MGGGDDAVTVMVGWSWLSMAVSREKAFALAKMKERTVAREFMLSRQLIENS